MLMTSKTRVNSVCATVVSFHGSVVVPDSKCRIPDIEIFFPKTLRTVLVLLYHSYIFPIFDFYILYPFLKLYLGRNRFSMPILDALRCLHLLCRQLAPGTCTGTLILEVLAVEADPQAVDLVRSAGYNVPAALARHYLSRYHRTLQYYAAPTTGALSTQLMD